MAKCDTNMWKQLIDIVAAKPTESKGDLIKKAEELAKTIRAAEKNEVLEKND